MRNGSPADRSEPAAVSGFQASDLEVRMLLLIALTVLAIISVSAAWGSGIDAEARLRPEPVRPVGNATRDTPAA
jgi:hypothetical protein